MSKDIEVKYYQNAIEGGVSVVAKIPSVSDLLNGYMANAFAHEVTRILAERYVEENYPALVAKLDQQAIANLAVADAGKKIAEEIRTQPVVLRERTVNNYSVF
jgi:hypothetical protein